MSTNTKTFKATTLVATLGLMLAIGISSCGKQEAPEAPKTEAPKTESPAPGATTSPAASTAPAAGGALSAAEKAAITPAKAALVMANTAIKGGDLAKAKAQFEKFSGIWTTVEPIVKAKAGASYPMIESGINLVKANLIDAKTPDKAKVGEGLTMAMKALDTLMNKK